VNPQCRQGGGFSRRERVVNGRQAGGPRADARHRDRHGGHQRERVRDVRLAARVADALGLPFSFSDILSAIECCMEKTSEHSAR